MVRQQRGLRRRNALVQAAADIAAEHGFGAVSHRAVARRAGVPLGSTTYYFASLDDLLGSVADVMVRECLDHGTAVTREAQPGPYTASEAAALLTRAVLPGEEPARVLCYYEQLLSAARHPAVAAVLHRQRPRLERMVAGVLGKTSHAGRFSPSLVLAVVDGAALSALSEGRSDVSALVAGRLSELLGQASADQLRQG